MDIKEFVQERITKNHLSIDIDECLETIKKYDEIYPGVSKLKQFFHFVLNRMGGILNEIDHETTEMLGLLKVRGKKDINFYEFDFDEDYYVWKSLRIDVYKQLKNDGDIRLLNYIELSTMNLITDITSNSKYELIDIKGKIIEFNKTGYGNDIDKQSFIKFLGGKFKEGYSFKPIL